MGKTIELDGVKWAAREDRQEFSVNFRRGGIDFAMYGDPKIIIQMLYQVMETYPEATKTILSTVVIFADKKGIPLEDLKKHSYPMITPNIITD